MKVTAPVAAAAVIAPAAFIAGSSSATAVTTVHSVADVSGVSQAVQLDASKVFATHPVEAAQVKAVLDTYTVKSGDTLSGISSNSCNTAKDWTGIYHANKHEIKDPNLIFPGQHLKLDCKDLPVIQTVAVVKDGDGDTDGDTSDSPASQPAQAAAPAAAPAAPAASYAGAPGSFQACVIQAESGGDATAQNPTSTASGLYGFLDTTWTSVTGLPGPARDYSVAEQNAAFDKAYALWGTSPWAAYDGC